MDKFFIIPHTHWEGAVFKTRQEYLEMGLPHILYALQLLKTQPGFRFVLDQVCYVRPFLERYPEEKEAFCHFLTEGRLEIAGGLVVMTDANIPGGESFVRQVLYGKGYCRRELSVDVTSGWLLDTFGQNAQMPQLLKLSGYRAHWFWRGIQNLDHPGEFFWEGIDGTRIPAFWMPYGYGIAYDSPKTLPAFQQFFQERYERLRPFYRSSNLVALAGVDVCPPEDHLAGLVEQFNLQNPPFQLVLAVPSEYEAAIEASNVEKPVVKGEMNPIFQGGYSSRILLKQHTRELERLLTTAEKLGAILSWVGTSEDKPEVQTAGQQRLWQAWEPVLFNQAHDLMSGVMTDHVYEDTLTSYEYAHRIASQEINNRMERLLIQVDTQGDHTPGDGIALVVFNPSGCARTDIATIEVGFGDPQRTGVELLGPDGLNIPYQVMDADFRQDGTLLRARIAFIARDVPALGYRVYRLLVNGNAIEVEAPSEPDSTLPVEAWLENEFYHLEFDPVSGVILRLIDKKLNWSVIGDQPGNVIAMENDQGDLWELYRPLDGASTIAMKEQHTAPSPGKATFSTDKPGDLTLVKGRLLRGAVFSQYTVDRPFPSQGKLRTTLRLVAGSRRIEFETRILNNDRFVRYRVLFPTTIHNGTHTHEIPFGAIQRLDGIEMPAQNWVDTSDVEKGVALLNRGLPGNNIAKGTMMLSLMRSTRIVAYGFAGGYEPGMSSDSGFEPGQEFTFQYALVPHAGNWQEAMVYQHGQAFNNPLIVQKTSIHPGKPPEQWGRFRISHDNILLSALKPGEEAGVVLRLYEASGKVTPGVQVRLPGSFSSVEEVNLMEDPIRNLHVNDGIVVLDFHPFEIKSLRCYR